jgi:ribosomal protein S18 acetylase RimI-like enzyme
MKIKFAPARHSHINYMIKINENSMPENYDLKFWENKVAEHMSFVAKYENVVVAYVLIAKYLNGYLIYSFAVDVVFRGNGIGKKLLQHAIKEFKKNKNNAELHLTVRSRNYIAQNLYKNIGFKTITEHPSYYLDDSGIEMLI